MSNLPKIYTPIYKVTVTAVRDYRYRCLEHHSPMTGGTTDKLAGKARLTFKCGCEHTVAMK